MILNILRTSFTNLKHDRAALVLTFVLPIVFFSIFATIFGGRSGARPTPRTRVIVVDNDQTDGSRRFIVALQKEEALSVLLTRSEEDTRKHDSASAEATVRSGNAPVALILPAGFGAAAIDFSGQQRPRVQLLADTSDPIAPPLVTGLLQKVLMTGSPAQMAEAGIRSVDQWSGGLTEEQQEKLKKNLEVLRQTPAQAAVSGSGGALLEVEVRDILGESKKSPLVAFYAAGTGVMFLLFTAAGSGGSILDEAESGTLDRLLSTHVTMTKLLLGKLVYLTLLGLLQLTVMFVWGALLFGLELMKHLPGFIIMTVVTSLAVSAFGLLLASICRTRAQLGALSTLVILIISAIGGSMFPRFLMPEAVQKFSLVAFNSWALEGYLKVFWREEPLSALWPEVTVLLGTTIVFMAIARQLAKRWEIA